MKIKLELRRNLVPILLSLPLPLLAGSLEPPGPPGSTLSYRLEDIYNRLDSGEEGSKSTFTGPTSAPGSSTGHTIDEIMDKAPVKKDGTVGAEPDDVASGKEYWGLTDGNWGLKVGTGTIATNPAPVAKTGQVISFVTGDDGDLKKGVTTSPRFTNNDDGTVTDNLTGLIWLTNANCAGAERNWTTALSDVVQLNTDGTMNSNNCGDTGNQTDWRLPNVREFHSLIDFSNSSPALPSGHPFSGVQTDYYWSSSVYVSVTTLAWCVNLNGGYVNSLDKSGSNYVWPVRGGF